MMIIRQKAGASAAMENEEFDISGMDRIELTIVYILGQLDGLVAKGIVHRDAGADRLSDLGKDVFISLRESGFKPTESELSIATEVFRSADPTGD
jgi:hypothetical protein